MSIRLVTTERTIIKQASTGYVLWFRALFLVILLEVYWVRLTLLELKTVSLLSLWLLRKNLEDIGSWVFENSMNMNSCIFFRLWVLGGLIFTAAVNEREYVFFKIFATFSFPKFSLSTKQRVATYVINACKRFPHNVEKRFFFLTLFVDTSLFRLLSLTNC